MKNYWISWYHHMDDGPFEYHGPWWVSGFAFDPDRDIIVAAIQAESEDAAWTFLQNIYDTPLEDIDRRFINEQEDDWNPLELSDRFPAADWMKWPVLR